MPHHSLPTGLNIDIFDGHLLLTFAPVFIEDLDLPKIDGQ